MSKKKTKKQGGGGAKEKSKKIVRDWENYFGAGDLEDWQRLMSDLGFEGEEFTSKTQCRKSLRGVWVNIQDFLDANRQGTPVYRFRSEHDLSHYTLKQKKIYPKSKIPDGSPLAKLLAHIL